MGSALEAPVAVTKDGWAVPVISELVTHAAMSMGLVRMASVNAALGGMESTALLRVAQVYAMEMVDAHWTKMVGTACASWAGGVRDVTPPWKLLVEMEKIMMEIA